MGGKMQISARIQSVPQPAVFTRPLMAILVFCLTSTLRAQTYAVLHNFTGGTTDAAYPDDSLILSGTTLYGMTPSGGTENGGAIFSINTLNDQETLLHSFTG